MLRRVSLAVAIAGTTLFATGGCSITDLLGSLTGLVPGLQAS
jgi:hypothetical protein